MELKAHTYTSSPKIILCGNKVDLASERQVDSSAAFKICKELNLPYVETSAFTGLGLQEAMEALAKTILSAIDPSVDSDFQRPRLFSLASKDEEWEMTFAEWKHSREGLRCC